MCVCMCVCDWNYYPGLQDVVGVVQQWLSQEEKAENMVVVSP